MIIATDTETYKQFDGSRKCYNYIKDNQLKPELFFKFKEMKKGNYYPLLNSKEYSLGVIIDETGKTQVFYTAESHFNALMEYKKKYPKVFIYAHNHKFDFYAYAQNHFFDEKMKIIIERTLYAIYDEKTYFHDTTSFYKMPLKKLGELLCFPKMILPKEIKGLEQLVDYCIQDTKIVLEAVLDLKKKLNLLGFKPKKIQTAGSTAMSTFLSHCRKKNIHWSFMRNGEVYKSPNTEKLRYAYRGGRCCAYKKGVYENCTVIDMNSAFSKSMIELEFPELNNYIYLENPTLENWEIISKHIGVIQAKIKINVKKGDIPYLSVYCKGEDRSRNVTFYPKKCVAIGTWTIKELKFALEIGQIEIQEIIFAECYKTSKINPFEEYILSLYDLGIKDKTFKSISKLLRNNLYGKFAQKVQHKESRLIFRAEIKEYQAQGWDVAGYIDDKVFMEKKGEPYVAKYTNPLISALITAHERHSMWIEINKVPRDQLIYWSEDSIIIQDFAKIAHLFDLTPDKLGAFKIEKEGPANIRGRKNYTVGDKNVLAGVPSQFFDKKGFENGFTNIKRQIGIRKAIQLNDSSLIGTFENVRFDLKGKDIDSMKIPEFIDERKYYE